MYTKRIIPCLDVKDGRVVKGTNFVGLRDAGDPVELAARYDEERADELVFLDITASSDNRGTMVNVARDCASKVFIPFTVGGGIRTVEDMRRMLKAGADKTSLNTAAVKNPGLLKEGAEKFGRQCMVLAVDARRAGDHRWEVYVNGGKQVMSSYSYAPKGPRAIRLVAESGSLTVTAGSSPRSPKDSSKARGTKSEQRISSAIWSTTA